MGGRSGSRVAVVDCGSRTTKDIAAALVGLGAAVVVVPLGSVGTPHTPGSGGTPHTPGDALPDHDALVVSGGPRLFTGEPELIERFAFLDALTVPTLGVCLGHQALGMRRGARIFRGAERRAPEPMEIVAAHALVAGLGEAPVFRADHCEGIDLPEGFVCLARSPHYAVEAMAHAELPLFGVQFHPEVSGEPGLRLFANFLSLITRL
jgi:GMP synthase-like glutamine amidotransferase